MNLIRIRLDYGATFLTQSQRGSSLGMSLPVKVLDAQGTILAEAVASSYEPAEVELPQEHGRVFVRLTWPSGRTEIQDVMFSKTGAAEIVFSDAGISRNEWSAWAIPRLNQRSPLAERNRAKPFDIDRYAKVWLRVWMFKDGQWRVTPIRPSMQYRSDAARQVDLNLESYPHLLHIGGSNVPWRFVALPSGGPCRVLLTPNTSNDPRADSLKVVVTSFRTDTETLLEFLSRDSMRAATTMAASESMAVELFAEKLQDPLAAVAGGYFLLRLGNWDLAPLSWWENLSVRFPWVPDTAILHCVRLLRAGLGTTEERAKALTLFRTCAERGWPVYEEGLRLLQEAGSLLKHIAGHEDAPYFSRIETLATAKSWAGAALSFYGREPSKPSAVLWVGMPQAPRRHKLAVRGWQEQVTDLNSERSEVSGIANTSTTSRQLTSISFAEEFAPKAHHLSAGSESGESSGVERIESDLYSGKRVARSGRKPKPKVQTTSNDWMLLGDIGT